MKCIQAIREGKYSKIGDIRRVDNKDADEKVAGGYWKYVAKSEWKLATRKPKEETKEEVAVEQTIAEKQLNRKKNKK